MSIVNKMDSVLKKKIVLIKANNEPSLEYLQPTEIILGEREKFPLNYLYHLQNEHHDEFENLNNIINDLFEDTKVRVVNNEGQIAIEVIQNFRNTDYTFDISEMGDGFRKSLSMIIRIFVSNSDIIMIDEPDSSMHSKLIKDMISYLRKLDRQIILSTHNEVFINEFPRENLKFVNSVSPVFSEVEDYRKYDIENIFSTLGVNPAYRRSLLLYSHLVLLVEGKKDEDYIKLLSKKTRHDHQLAKYRISYEYNGGSKIPQLEVIDKINNARMPIMLVRDRDEYKKDYYQKHIKRLGDRIHFWRRREIENYFLSFNSIYKAITEQARKRDPTDGPTPEQIRSMIIEMAASLIPKTALMNIFLNYKTIYLTEDLDSVGEFSNRIENWPDTKIIDEFYDNFLKRITLYIEKSKIKEEFINEKFRLQIKWREVDNILETCPGKDLRIKMNKWLEKYQVRVDIEDFYRNIESSEIDQDFHTFIEKVVGNCNSELYLYLHHYKYHHNNGFLNFSHNKLYFNENYYISCPQFKNDIIYVNGTSERNSPRSKSTITIYHSVLREIIDTISIGTEATISHMFYDRESGLLFAAAGVKNGERIEDSILIIDPVSQQVYKIWLGSDESEGKEGAVGSLVVYSFNKKKGIIYAASVYAEGGNPALYVIEYEIHGDVVESKVNQWTIGRYGPLALCMDHDNGRIYALSHGDDREAPQISIILGAKGKLLEDRITLPDRLGSITPYKGSLLSIDYRNHNLLAVAGGQLFSIDPISKRITNDRSHEYLYITSSFNTKNVYAVTEEEDVRSTKPYFNCLRVIRPDLQTNEIMKLSPEVEIIDIHCSENKVCLNARYRDREQEYSLWLFNEPIMK
jgi:hypothetical protein